VAASAAITTPGASAPVVAGERSLLPRDEVGGIFRPPRSV
jgi:hypothetical protein